MIYKFTFDVKAINLNHCRTINARGNRPIITKTQEYRDLENAVEFDTVKYSKKHIQDFKSRFDPKKHCLVAQWIFYTPNLFILNKTKKPKVMPINLKSGDLSNTIKPVEDSIFKILEIADDAHVTDMIVSKRYAEKHKVEFNLRIIDLQNHNIILRVINKLTKIFFG